LKVYRVSIYTCACVVEPRRRPTYVDRILLSIFSLHASDVDDDSEAKIMFSVC
jgi:hypothetical protein